jgi:hypothetical protein
MRQDRARRAKRRFTCSFTVRGQSYRGITLNLSMTGLFVQTDTTVPPGSPIELHLMGAGLAPDVHITGVVARRRAVPQTLATVIRRGIGVRITAAPVEYGLMFQDALLAAPIKREKRGSPRVGSERNARPDAPIAPLEPPVRTDPLPAVTPVPTPSPPPPPPRDTKARDLVRPDVLLMDDGSLEDVYELLQEIGVDGLRIRTAGGSSPQAWVRPHRLLLTSASLALSFPWPMSCEEDGFIGIAVSNDHSQTLAAHMARLGFRYLVSRPIHPQALRILLRQVFYRGGEKRRTPRFAFDSEIVWRSGMRRHAGQLVEISAEGCLILTDCTDLRRHSPLKITIPFAAAGQRSLTLKGRVVRSSRIELPEGGLGQALAVGFWRASSRAQRGLSALLQRCAEGHIQAPRMRAALQAAPGSRVEDLAMEPDGSELTDTVDELFARDDLAEVEGEAKAETSLLGSELSITGMRVGPESALKPGQCVALELYEGSYHEPMVLQAEVCSEDDVEGFLLRFVAPTPADSARIASMMNAPPTVRSLDGDGRRIVPGRIRPSQD